MPKVTVRFEDTQKEDKEGNPLVDIVTLSKPEFPEKESDYSPAQKAAIKFLCRGGQPDFQTLLCKLNAETILVKSKFEEIQQLLTEENCGMLPFDIKIIELNLKDIQSMIEEAIGTYN